LQPGSGEILDTHGDTVAIIPVLLLRLASKTNPLIRLNCWNGRSAHPSWCGCSCRLSFARRVEARRTADALEAVVARQNLVDRSFSCGVLGEITRSVLAFALEPAGMLLGVEFEPDPLDQVKLGLEEVDMMLLVRHQ
jgi:hypothetical protein